MVTDVFFRAYGPDWFEEEVFPYMKNIRSYSTDENVIEEYERLIAHNNGFSEADATIYAKLLLFDGMYSGLIRSMEMKKLLKQLLFYRNECIYSFKDISSMTYEMGIGTVSAVEQLLLLIDNASANEPADDTVKQRYDEARHKAEYVMNRFKALLVYVSWIGVALGCICIFVYWDDDLRWMRSSGGWKIMLCVYLAHISISVSTQHRKLMMDKKYIHSKSRILIVIDNIWCVAKACVKNFLQLGHILVLMIFGSGISDVLVSWLELVIEEVSLPSIVQLSCVCAAAFFIHIIWGVKLLQVAYIDALLRRIEKNPSIIFRCPKCKTEVCVPKGVKKIRIICPSCQKRFVRRRGWRNFFNSKNLFLLTT